MAKITITYPTTWLIVSISVKDRLTWVEEFTWLMTEIAWVYNYDFTEATLTDYTYTATTPWYGDVSWVLFQDTSTWGWWATVADIWGAQIWDYDNTPWSFANKFSSYWGVSHVIEKVWGGGLSDGDKLELTNLIWELTKKIDELEKKWIGKETIREVVRIEKIAVPSIDSTWIVDALIEWMSEMNSTLTDTFIEAVEELKNK